MSEPISRLNRRKAWAQCGTSLDGCDALGVDTMIKRTQILVLALTFCFVATAAWADFKLERKLALEPGGSFILETDIGSVLLTGEPSSGARVLITSDEDLDRDFEFAFSEEAEGSRSRSSGAGCAGCSAGGSTTTTPASRFRCPRKPRSGSARPAVLLTRRT